MGSVPWEHGQRHFRDRQICDAEAFPFRKQFPQMSNTKIGIGSLSTTHKAKLRVI